MKKLYTYMLAIALGAVAGAGCSNDAAEEPQPAAVQGRTITVVASLSDETKAAFNRDGLRWTAGDQIRWSWTDNSTSDYAESAALTAADISENGTKATFTITIPDDHRTGWFFSVNNANWSGWINSSYVEFQKNYSYQSSENVMIPQMLFLHSGPGTMEIPADAETISFAMEIPGSIFRFLPYTTQYNTERIKQVALYPRDGKRLTGAVIYYHNTGIYKDANENNGQYLVRVTANSSIAASREDSRCIYAAIPRTNTPIEGYSCIVTTDKAAYYFETSNRLEVKDNTVKNIFLDLDKGERLANDAETTEENHLYDVYYKKNIGDEITFNYEERTDRGKNIVAYLVPRGLLAPVPFDNYLEVAGTEADFYNATFSYDGEESSDWVSCAYLEDSFNIRIDLTENTSTESRSAKVKAHFNNPTIKGGYIVLEAYRDVEFTITQTGKPEE